jgi:hypothetical protein
MKNIGRFGFVLLTGLALCLTLVFSCVTPPEYPKEPFIEFLSISKDTMPRLASTNDSVLVTLGFTDGDGDLGSEESDLFYIDDRDGLEFPGIIPKVPPLGASNGIKGEISFIIDNSCCDYPDSFLSANECEETFPSFPLDTINYKVYIVDRAGNKSNIVELPPVYIRCMN